jgi:FMN-dependent NADH-azoreductase
MRGRIAFAALLLVAASVANAQSVARQWNEALLGTIRLDYSAPTVHSRNLFHLSAAMYDAWAAYDPRAKGHFSTRPRRQQTSRLRAPKR